MIKKLEKNHFASTFYLGFLTIGCIKKNPPRKRADRLIEKGQFLVIPIQQDSIINKPTTGPQDGVQDTSV